MKPILVLFFSLLQIIASTACLIAQANTAFPSMLYSRSVFSSGLGEQGVASNNASDAMEYNPANLVFARSAEISFFRNPMKVFATDGVPLTSLNAAARLENGAGIGLEYTTWRFAEYPLLDHNGNASGEVADLYERSVAAGYAMSLGSEWSLGAELRYLWMSLPQGSNSIDHVLISAGFSCKPKPLHDRLILGLSLMNIGTRISYPPGPITESEYGIPRVSGRSQPPPSQFNLGLQGLPLTNPFYDVSVSLGASKVFDDNPEFTDDITGQVGLGYLWHPVPLGMGVSLIQQMYVGYFSVDSYRGSESFFTHGMTFGLTGFGVKATVGYAGRWHNNNAGGYPPWILPWETVQLTISSDLRMFGNDHETRIPEQSVKRMVLSSGYSYGVVVGKMKETRNGDMVSLSTNNSSFWSVAADFYVNDNSAILTSFAYARMMQTIVAFPSTPESRFEIDNPLETVSLESGYRLHPIDQFHPFFVQASLGIIRINPVNASMTPKYYYQTFDEIAVGGLVPVMDSGIVLMPRIGLKTILMSELSSASRLGGYNQFTFGINVGYQM